MDLRELRAGEEERLLDLLDGWPFSDGRRGRDFFRRYLEDDPSFEPGNVWVAEHEGGLVACVQVFPRTVRTTGGTARCGGIGSVFTLDRFRRSGLASELLELAVESMGRRGMGLSLLLASRVRWYESLGWRKLPGGERLLQSTATPRGSSRPMAEDDLDVLARIAERYGRHRPGSVVRDREAWRASLRLAGDPEEEFVVAAPTGTVEAYLRLAHLDGALRALEWGCLEESRDQLADLLLAHARGGVVLPPIRDPELERRLLSGGGRLSPRAAGASWMVRPVGLSEAEVRGLIPEERFAFWPADRF